MDPFMTSTEPITTISGSYVFDDIHPEFEITILHDREMEWLGDGTILHNNG